MRGNKSYKANAAEIGMYQNYLQEEISENSPLDEEEKYEEI